MAQRNSMTDYMNKGSEASITIFSPSRSVIVDMIMIQFIAIIISCFSILVFKGDSMDSSDLSILLVGIFGAIIFLTSLYSRITR
mgnify:CR=1 FL=1